MSKKIVLVTTAHSPLDDRIYHHFAKAFQKYKYQVSIICSTKKIDSNLGGINIKGFESINISQFAKIHRLISLLEIEKPDIIICSEPLAILAASKYRKKNKSKCSILFDITEWYPSKINLFGTSGIKKILKALKLLLFNFYTSFLCHGFIFGEYYKSLPYRYLFPFKKGIIISYYPNLEYIQHFHYPLLKESVSLCFTGKFCEEKGFYDFLKVASFLHQERPKLKIILNMIGWFAHEQDKDYFLEFKKSHPFIEIQQHNYLDFHKFIDTIQKSHIFFDLRKMDAHNNYCLPIKLFYYMAVGRPVIYSNLKAIKKELDISAFGHLVNPKDYKKIASIVLDYVDHPDNYEYQGQSARLMSETDYNWDQIEGSLIQFVATI